MKIIVQVFLLSFLIHISFAQTPGIGIGTTSPHPSAQLDVSSTDKGFLMPRMNAAQRQAIIDPATGLMVFDVDKNSLYLFDGVKWSPIGIIGENDLFPVEKQVTSGEINDHLGYAVAISGDYAIIGAPYDSVGANALQGSAYIFKRGNNGWTEQAKITTSNGAAGDKFGYAVAISGDYALIGTYKPQSAGTAYIFFRNGTQWAQQEILTATGGLSGNLFGTAVSISGDYALVGAPGDKLGTDSARGAAFVFFRNGTAWGQQAKLAAADEWGDDQFGVAVGIDENRAIIGAPRHSDYPEYASEGAAYPFIRSGTSWSAQAKIWDGTGPLLGNHISISGNYAAIAKYHSVSVYFYDGTKWIYHNVASSDIASNFGVSVSLSGDYLAVGSVSLPLGAFGADQTGQVFVFKRDGTDWKEIRYFYKVSPGKEVLSLGMAVAFSDSTLDLLAGAPEAMNNQSTGEKGKVFFLNLQ